MPQDLPSLTSIRWFLALGVVLFHYQLNMLAPDAAGWGLIERARLPVDVFFVLSGLVLAHVYSRQVEQGRYSHRRFLVARFARIYPAHIAMLAVIVVLAAVAIGLGQRLEPFDYGLDGLFAAALLIHAWFPITAGNEWNGPSWSLSAEWGAYLLFPAFAWAGLRFKHRPLILAHVRTTRPATTPLPNALTSFAPSSRRWFSVRMTSRRIWNVLSLSSQQASRRIRHWLAQPFCGTSSIQFGE